MKTLLKTLLRLLAWLYVMAAVPLGIMFLYTGFAYNRYFQVIAGVGVFFLFWKITNWLDLF